MNRKLQLIYLIEQYCNGNYDTQTFSSWMTKIYYMEKDDSLSEKEKEILTQQAINEGKPANIAEKMVAGRIAKYYKENCLVEQAFVKDDKQSINAYTNATAKELGGDIKIVAFTRFEKGEGLEKKEDNFAEEIASMTK